MMVILLGCGVAQATDVSIGTDIASAYVFRGITVNDGLVIQPYAIVSGFPIPENRLSSAVIFPTLCDGYARQFREQFFVLLRKTPQMIKSQVHSNIG